MKNLINYLSKKSLSLGNGSGMTRKRLENGSGMTRKRLGIDSGMTRLCLASLICLCMLTVGVGNAWGQASSATVTDGGTYVVCAYSGSKYYALPNNTTAGTWNGTEVTVNGSGQVTTADAPTWTMKRDGTSARYYLTYKSGNNTYYLYKNGTSTSNKNIKGATGDKNYWTFTAGTGGNAGKYQVIAYNRGSNHTCLTYTSSKWQVSGTSGYSIILLELAPACSTKPTVGSSLTSVSATVNSITATVPISAIGGCNITENGLVYSTSVATPTVGAANCTKVTVTACGSTAANKEVTISDLTCGTTYYIRGYATNGAGTSYTNAKTQATSDCPLFTITYNAGSGTCGTASWTQPSYGASTTLPTATAPATCTGWSFAGWCTSSAGSADENSTSPGTILTGSYTPTGNVTLYAIYKRTASGGTTTYTLVDDAANFEDGTYVVAGLASSTYYFMDGNVSAGAGLGVETTGLAAASVSDGSFASTSLPSGAIEIDVEDDGEPDGDNHYYFISYTSGGDTYYLDDSGTKQSLTWTTNTNVYTYHPNFTQNAGTDGCVLLSGSGAKVSQNGSTKASFIRNYASSGSFYNDMYFFKKSSGTTYYMTSLVCCTDPGLAYGTGSVTKTYGASAFTNTLTNSHSVAVTYSSSDPTVATVNGSGQVTILKAGSTTITASSAAQTVAAVSYCADEASYTLTVNKANISPTLTYTPNSVAVGENTSAPTVGGNPGSGGVTYTITSATPAGCATINTSTGVVTGVAVGSVTVTATVAATTNYNGNTATATVTITAASYFPQNKTLFFEAKTQSESAWKDGAQCKAWFRDCDSDCGEAPWTYWQTDGDSYKKYYAVVIPSTGNYPYITIQRYSDYTGNTSWGEGGAQTYSTGGGSNVIKSTCASGECLSWSPTSMQIYLRGDLTNDEWASNIGELTDQNGGIWSYTYNNFASDGSSLDFKLYTNYNTWIGNTSSNNNATLSGMNDGSTYNITATYNVVTHSLVMSKTFVKGTVHFDLQGHGLAISDLTNVAAGSKISAPSEPSATGWDFGGWFKEPACTNEWNFASNEVDETMTLYAKWTKHTYTITSTLNNCSSSPAIPSSYEYTGSAASLSYTITPSSGYRLPTTISVSGVSYTWDSSTGALVLTGTITSNVTITISAVQTHTVDWYVGGSAPANKIGDDGQTTVVDHGGKIEDFPATTPDGSACDKTFVGWTNTSSYVHGTSPLFTTVEGSPTINANASFYAVFAEVNSVSASLTKMTADDDLEVGDKIVIIAQDTRYGMYQASASSYVSYWTTTDVDGEPSLSEIEADDKKYLDVAAGGATDTWKLGDATNGYLYNSSSTNLEFSTTSSSDLTLIKWTDDSFTLQAGQYISCRTDITGANANKWRGAGASCDPENDNNCSGTEYYYLYKYVPGGTTATGHTINCADCGSSVTVSYSAPGSGNTMTVTKSAAAVASGTVIKTCSAQELTITLTPATHYTADGLTATGVAGVTTSNVGNVYTVTIPAAGTGTLTLTPTFTPETPLSITFIPTVSGATVGSIGTIYSGDNFDFPSVSNLPVGFCADFLGWVDFTNGETFDGDGTRTTAPSELITAGTNSGTMTANKIYKAVYGESETSEVEAYSKVTSSLADWSGNYLIVHEGSARALDGSLGTSNIDAQGNYFSVTISAGKITDDHSTKHWTITKIGETSTYTIKGASGCYIGRATTGNGIDKTTEGASADANTISYSSGVTISGSGGPSLQYYNTSGQERFRYYGSAQQAISLFKLGTTEIITYTYTTAPSCGEKYRVTVDEVTGGSPSVSPKYCADGTTISLVANPSTGYTFTSWTITKDADDSNVTSTLLTGDKQTTANTTFEMPAYDITVTATYTIINYNITYNNLNGATNSNPATYNVASADIDFVDPGARAGYIFKGWYDDAVYTNQVTGIPNGSTGAVTVYAKWAVGYTITWDNAIGSNPASTGVEEGNAIGTLPVPSGSCTFDGTTYSNFVGWYTGTISGVGTAASDAGTEITSADVPTANATYHAVYTNMPDYSGTNTSNVTLPEVATPKENVKVKVDDADDAPEYDGIKIGTSSTKTSSFTFTVPAGTTKITMQGVAWSGKTASVTLSTSVGTISPSTAQSLANSTGASDRSPFTITSNTTLTFNLTNVNSTATITVANSNERVIVWGINASSASGENVGYITQCCDNVMAAPTMNAPTVRTSTAITLSWNTVTNATGYKVSWNGGDWEDVATATTYEKTSLEPGTDYSYKVIAKYTSPYCGASVYEGVVSTKPVYSVTYERGHGTGSCSASGSIPAVAYYEEGAIVSLAASNTFSHPGNTFAAWSSEQVALTAESTTFTMPAENVTVTATWTAKQDKYYDRMHNLTSGEGSYTDGEGKHYIVREGCNYTVPSLTNSTTGDTDCHTTHYVLMGWAAAEHIQQTGENAGQVISGHESYVFTGGGTKTANNNTYYAVWAIVTE